MINLFYFIDNHFSIVRGNNSSSNFSIFLIACNTKDGILFITPITIFKFESLDFFIKEQAE